MKLHYRWEPRWPAFALGFAKNYKEKRYDRFNLIIWAIVLEVTW